MSQREDSTPAIATLKPAEQEQLLREARSPATAIHLYPYQRDWFTDRSRFKIGMFARQTGKTFTTSLEIVDDAFAAEAARRRSRWVMLSRGERQAGEAMAEAVTPFTKAYALLYDTVAPEFAVDEFRDGDVRYRALECHLPGGSRITALPANPATARGYSANVFLDEFAIHEKSREIWAALFPVVSRAGLKLRITSTPMGSGNMFHALWTAQDDIWSRHRVDIWEAARQGLDRDPEELRRGLNDAQIWAQEYELQFIEQASAWLSYELILSCESEEAGRPELYTGGPCYIGNDIGRRRNLWVAWVLEEVGDVLVTRELVAHRNIPFAEQDAIMDELMSRYRVVRLAMDQGGMGEKPVEDAKARYGAARVEGVLLQGSRRLDVATAGKQRFEDRRIRIPAGDIELRGDLHELQQLVGPTGAPRLVAENTEKGHADRSWAGFLACAAAGGPAVAYEGHRTAAARRRIGIGGAPGSDDDEERHSALRRPEPRSLGRGLRGNW